jgi:hypothetical protein
VLFRSCGIGFGLTKIVTGGVWDLKPLTLPLRTRRLLTLGGLLVFILGLVVLSAGLEFGTSLVVVGFLFALFCIYVIRNRDDP